jgi:hypothetical protein
MDKDKDKDKFNQIIQSKAFRQGISFSVVSSAMSVLGISLGVWSSSGNLKSIIGSIIGLSISNSLADAFSMYMSDKASGQKKNADVSSIVTATIEFVFPFIFLIPFLVFKLKTAVIINSIIGILLVGSMGFYLSVINKTNQKQTIEDIGLYILITIIIMTLTYYGGILVKKLI